MALNFGGSKGCATEWGLKITILSQFFWPENFKINDLARELQHKGHAVEVLTGQPNYPHGNFFSGYSWRAPWNDNFDGIPIKRIPVISRGRGTPVQMLFNYLSFVFFGLLLLPWRFDRKTDVIFVWNSSPIFSAIPALFLKLIYRKRAIIWVQDLWPDSLEITGLVKSKFLLNWGRRLCFYIYNSFDVVLAQSEAMQTRLVEMGIPKNRTDVVSNWAEDFYKPLDPSQCVEKDRQLPTGFRVVFAGNVGQAQSFSTIIGAAEMTRHLPDIQWIVFGDGRERAKIQSEVAGKNLQFHFMGVKDPREMPGYFAVSDLLLVTLRHDPTMAITIPGKVQTYMACGRPIVAAIDGEAARVIRESGSGFTCRAEDSKGLADGIVAMYKMPEIERKVMAASGREFYLKSFERSQMIARVERLLQNLV